MKKVYIETYGCQMNLADTEIVLSILSQAGYTQTTNIAESDVVLVNTCAVRDNAEQRVFGRIGMFRQYKKKNSGVVVGALGCMAEHLRQELFDDDAVDFVVGPDEYRKLPSIIEAAQAGEKGIAVRLSRVETYEDIIPLRTDGISAWIAIMRGCNNFCSYCVVPFTRGRERSRSLNGIVQEVERLSLQGFKEVTLLGQNVNSYHDGTKDFADLLDRVARIDRTMRIRFTTSHPYDMSDKLIDTIALHSNICNFIHLPLQSGSNRILKLMNRAYTIEHYQRLVSKIREHIPSVALSTDIIAGFPMETEDDHRRTLEALEEIQFDGAFTFKYSPRKRTKACSLNDDVPEEEKIRRLNEIIELQRAISLRLNEAMIGKTVEVLVEGTSKKSENEYCGRTDTNKMVVFPHSTEKPGDYLTLTINHVNAATLFGTQINQQREKIYDKTFSRSIAL
ncbi:MAG TPA: tRNA (N6-isopentenyl adenosine(37)-C2)-methylthiotransferase MiaB [Bacteroidota bacterium]|nr:tRNA (N6-isopentenyl adenosine(37)-C2)-methylthiotransferase MiaB [Bacteroidota bacterium]